MGGTSPGVRSTCSLICLTGFRFHRIGSTCSLIRLTGLRFRFHLLRSQYPLSTSRPLTPKSTTPVTPVQLQVCFSGPLSSSALTLPFSHIRGGTYPRQSRALVSKMLLKNQVLEDLTFRLLGKKSGPPNGPIVTQPPLNRKLSKIKEMDLFPHLCI